jgi:hypothetical protein
MLFALLVQHGALAHTLRTGTEMTIEQGSDAAVVTIRGPVGAVARVWRVRVRVRGLVGGNRLPPADLPWAEVQAVMCYRQQGQWFVRLIPERGKPVRLRAPTTYLGFGAAGYERDFHRIGECWLAHRGESWRLMRTEAPSRPVQR